MKLANRTDSMDRQEMAPPASHRQTAVAQRARLHIMQHAARLLQYVQSVPYIQQDYKADVQARVI
jgi:hypothetical protein